MRRSGKIARDILTGLGARTTVLEQLTVALTHAVLEQAEQQRAANLIAYERLRMGRPDQGGQRPRIEIPETFVTAEIDRILDMHAIADAHDRAGDTEHDQSRAVGQ